VLRYGDLTARGIEGGRAGVKVDWAPIEVTKEATSRLRRYSCMMTRLGGGGGLKNSQKPMQEQGFAIFIFNKKEISSAELVCSKL
jgi:hypothetical protein